jgi:hypothetical protein
MFRQKQNTEERKGQTMRTHCSANQFVFQELSGRSVVGAFNGGTITSDAGGLLLREIEQARGFIKEFAWRFDDFRDQRFVEHSVEQLVAQRAYGLCLDYEDLNDHDRLRSDPLFAVLCGKEDPEGNNRRDKYDRGKALAGKSTLNRLETAGAIFDKRPRYKKIVADMGKLEEYFVDTFLRISDKKPPRLLILDFDATDDPLHGKQEGRFFHGYYDCYCYLPLYVFCGDHLLWAQLRKADIDASKGAVEVLELLVKKIRNKWPRVRILLRGDSGFCREELMNWCEAHGLYYLLGMAKNSRLLKRIHRTMKKSKRDWALTGKAARRYLRFVYRTRSSWSRARRVVAKAEYMDKGENPRFIVSNLPSDEFEPQALYEQMYCARGEMENRIKEQQLYLFADRTSSATMRANQLRLWFSSLAYVILNELRRVGLRATKLARATCETIRLKLLKIGAQVRVSVRRVNVSFATGYPYQELFIQTLAELRQEYHLQR